MYDRSIHDSATFSHDAPLSKQPSYSLHQLLLKFLRFEQVPKSPDTALVWDLIHGSLTQAKLPDRLTVVQGIFHPIVGQILPGLAQVYP